MKTEGYLSILRDKASSSTASSLTASVAPAWPVVTGISLENMEDYHEFYGDDTLFMDHIDIYRDVASSTEKLDMLKEKLKRS